MHVCASVCSGTCFACSSSLKLKCRFTTVSFDEMNNRQLYLQYMFLILNKTKRINLIFEIS